MASRWVNAALRKKDVTVTPSSPEKDVSNLEVLRFLWGKLGTFSFFVACAALLGMMGQDSPVDQLKLVAMGSYTLALFATPMLAIFCVLLSVIGIRYAKIASAYAKPLIPVPWEIKNLSLSSYQTHIAALSLFVCICLPLFTNFCTMSKLLAGQYYYMPHDRGGCKQDAQKTDETCQPQGAWLSHFVPQHGIGNPLKTKYAYEGNKDYVPVIEPGFFCLLVLFATGYAARYAIILFRPSRPVALQR